MITDINSEDRLVQKTLPSTCTTGSDGKSAYAWAWSLQYKCLPDTIDARGPKAK